VGYRNSTPYVRFVEDATVSLHYDEICELPPKRSECLHIIRLLALDGFRMAQHVVSGQGFLEAGGGGGESIQPEVKSAILGSNRTADEARQTP